jgi:hypothetical protein
MGLRYGVGADFFRYSSMYVGIQKMGVQAYSWIEKPFRYYDYAMGIIFKDPAAFHFISSFVILFFFYKAIKEQSCDCLISIVVFIGLGFFFNAMNLVRQFMAVSISFYATRYLGKNYIKYVCWIIIASGFHVSCLVLIPIALIIQKVNSRFFYSFSLAVSFLFGIFGYQFLCILSKYSLWVKKVTEYTVTEPRISIPNLVIGVFVFILSYQYCRSTEQISWKLKYCWLAIMSIVGLAPLGDAATRVAFYFSTVYIILIPLIIKRTFTADSRFVAKILIIGMCYIFMLYTLVHSTVTGNHYIPYYSVLNKAAFIDDGTYIFE